MIHRIKWRRAACERIRESIRVASAHMLQPAFLAATFHAAFGVTLSDAGKTWLE